MLEIHSDFLSTCLNDCLLSNPTLLTTVKKILGVCLEFAEFLSDHMLGNDISDLDFEVFHEEVAR